MVLVYSGWHETGDNRDRDSSSLGHASGPFHRPPFLPRAFPTPTFPFHLPTTIYHLCMIVPSFTCPDIIHKRLDGFCFFLMWPSVLFFARRACAHAAGVACTRAQQHQRLRCTGGWTGSAARSAPCRRALRVRARCCIPARVPCLQRHLPWRDGLSFCARARARAAHAAHSHPSRHGGWRVRARA